MHDIDETTGSAAIAYRGEVPWHGLGATIEEGDSIAAIAKKAHVDFTVERAPVQYEVDPTATRIHPTRDVLYRSDTLAPLGIMAKGYKIVQPAAILDFFQRIQDAAGEHAMRIETVGALSGGARIWALAKVGEETEIMKGDAVAPYVLLATSFDGSLSTTGQATTVRVVCHNTITMALSIAQGAIKVPHHSRFDPDVVRDQLGIVTGAFAEWVKSAKKMAEEECSGEQADHVLTWLLDPNDKRPQDDIRESTGYRRLMELFEGAAIGSSLTQGRTKWQLLNAVTEYVDHRRGAGNDSRMNSAWFGKGDAMKSRAMELLS